MRAIAAVAISLALAACSTATPDSTPSSTAVPTPAASPTVRILLVGDVMLGRGVATVIEADESSVFAGVRHLITDADLAGANLESPLTTRPHTAANENALEADPAYARLLASTGFDLMSLPNNHTSDAGPEGILDTIAALDDAGIGHIGAGPDAASATAPAIFELSGIEVGVLAFDTTGIASVASTTPGVARWDEESSPAAVTALRNEVDVLVVSLDGGTEYLPTTDPGLAAISDALVDAGADVVWGHGAHVVQPVAVTTGERPAVVATSLGNFLFDQFGADRTTGYLLEIMADDQGVVAFRIAVTEHPDRRVEFVEWIEPSGDAVWVEDSWWSLVREPVAAATTATTPSEFRHGDLVMAAQGDVDGDGEEEIIVSFRRPFRSTTFMETHPDVQWQDADGRSAHLGVYDPEGLTEVWVAGSVLMPIAALEVCDGSLAVAHDRLDDATPIATGAWTWNGFGFDTAPPLPGTGTPGCADINGDGTTDPVILSRD